MTILGTCKVCGTYVCTNKFKFSTLLFFSIAVKCMDWHTVGTKNSWIVWTWLLELRELAVTKGMSSNHISSSK